MKHKNQFNFFKETKMKKARFLMVAAIAAAVMVSGCAKQVKKSGFLSTYKNLEIVSPTMMRYIGPDVGEYSKFIVDPITVKFYSKETSKEITPENIKHLEEYLYAQILKDKPAQYEIVTEPGPGVARMRIALTNLQKSSPALNVLPQTKLMGVGLGQASAEMELVDSETGKQLGAAIVSETGSRFSFAGLSKWGDVEYVMNQWAQKIWMRINEAHGIMPEK
jgi:hypothetical protein